MSWDTVEAKFTNLAEPFTSERTRRAIVEAVKNLETISARQLAAILGDLTA
mgnify:FL=1